jgi:hypothetical protein
VRNNLIFLFFAIRKSGTMDPKILVNSRKNKNVGSAKIWIRQKNKKSTFEFRAGKMFSKTALV